MKLSPKMKEYLRKQFLIDLCIEDEKIFWNDLYWSDFDSFLEMIDHIEPFSSNLILKSQTIADLSKNPWRGSIFDHSIEKR